MSSQQTEQALLEIIASSNELLNLLANDEPDTDRLDALQQLRHQQISTLFNDQSIDLAEYPDLVEQITTLDQQLLSIATSERDELKAKTLKHQQNRKATKAYQANL